MPVIQPLVRGVQDIRSSSLAMVQNGLSFMAPSFGGDGGTAAPQATGNDPLNPDDCGRSAFTVVFTRPYGKEI